MSGQVTVTVDPDWKAPAEDGEILLWPEVPRIVERTRENQRRLESASSLRIQNVGMAEVRAGARRWIGAGADRPVFAAGHQVELYHPGVWAKNLLINELARKMGGEAFHFAVDTDAPRHFQLRWPGGSAPLTDDSRLMNAAWGELVSAPTPAHLAHVEKEIKAAEGRWGFGSLMPEFFGAFRRTMLEGGSLARLVVDACHQVDWELGLRHHALLASPIWGSPAYLMFVHHLMARPAEFAEIYNGALRAYRERERIGKVGRPWPDLRVGADSIESPFWLDELKEGRRGRAEVGRDGAGWALRIESDSFSLDAGADGWKAAEELGRFLSAHCARLTPRALTLTAFLRLFVTDQFVHGIGGARYDRVTDDVIRGFLKIEPPAFSVTTATLLFPAAVGRRRSDLRELEREGRRLRHGTLNGAKTELVRRIEALPRNSLERRDLFYQMHRALRGNIESEAYRRWQERMNEARLSSGDQDALFDRELFYLIQPRERLQSLIDRYHGDFA